jgi:predicted amidophosphoribosyltransferase
MVHHLKYDGYSALGRAIARIVARNIRHPGMAWLVPVPLASRRLHQRGYNQSAVIARALAADWHLPLAGTVLRRVRETPSQTELDPARRRANVAGAFSARKVPRSVKEGRGDAAPAVILVDDVLTTGATLAAAAVALAAAGWSTVGAVTFARALPFEASITATAAPGRTPVPVPVPTGHRDR